MFITAHSGDISAFGANIGSDGTVSLDAAQNLLLTSALSSSQNSSENSSFGGSLGFGIGAGGLSPTGSVNASFGQADGWTNTHTNTHIDGADVYLSSGNDTTIAGGRVSGDTITVDVGGDFDLHSLQDTGERANSSFGFGLGFGGQGLGNGNGPAPNLADSVAAFNLGNGVSSVSPSFGIGSGSTAWVTEQSGLFSTGDVSVYVSGNTDLLSSVIGSTEGNVTIDTATLTFADLTDHDTYTDFSINATFNSALWTAPQPTSGSPSDQPEGNPLCASIGGCTSPNWTTQGHYAFDDRRQNTVTTIGVGSGSSGDTASAGITRDGETEEAQETETAEEEGSQSVTITIRDEEAQQELEDSGATAGVDEINSNLALVQVLTKDEHERVNFYLSDSSIKAALNAGKTVTQMMSGLMGLINESGLDKAFKDGMNPADAIKQILACKNAQHGFNLFEYIFATAHAAGKGCTIEYTDKNGKPQKAEIHDTKSCLTVLQEGLNKIGIYNISEIVKGFGQGSLDKLKDYGNLVGNPDAVAKAMLKLAGDIYRDPDGTAIKMATDMKEGFKEKYANMLKEMVKDKPNMQVVGKILGGITTDIIASALVGGAGGVAFKAMMARIRKQKKKDNSSDNNTDNDSDSNGNGNNDNPRNPNIDCASFAPQTLVLMGDQKSFRQIASLRIGDSVASRNEITGRYSSNLITALPGRLHTDKVTLQLENADGKLETITTTLEHPFHVQGKGFVTAGTLKAGMKVTSWQPRPPPVQVVGYGKADSTGHLLVKAITVVRDGLKPWRAYNLSVENDHTYFVGKSRAWVHNSGDDLCGMTKTGETRTRTNTNGKEKTYDVYKDKDGNDIPVSIPKRNTQFADGLWPVMAGRKYWVRGLGRAIA